MQLIDFQYNKNVKFVAIMDINIGMEIKRVAKQHRMGATELAKKLAMTAPNVHKIWRKRSIDTELLYIVSKALNFDFFALYTDRYLFQKGLESAMLGPNAVVELGELEKCKQERDHLTEKFKIQSDNAYNQQKYIKLLEQKLTQLEEGNK